MSDRRDQASKELLPDEPVSDAGELDDVSTEWNEAEFHDETNDADHLVEDQDLGEALSPEDAASFLVWLAAAPQTMVLTETVMMPLKEQGWP